MPATFPKRANSPSASSSTKAQQAPGHALSKQSLFPGDIYISNYLTDCAVFNLLTSDVYIYIKYVYIYAYINLSDTNNRQNTLNKQIHSM